MVESQQNSMRAVAIERFGGLDTLRPTTLPLPDVGPDEILIRVEAAGVGVWDPFEREGGFAQMSGIEPAFPYVLGSDGAGIVVRAGSDVRRFKEGDRVYAVSLASPRGGFYAEYAAVKADLASHVPAHLPMDQAGAMPVDAVTALRGLDDALQLKKGESLLIFGASGGVGHLAVQLAQRLGIRVLAVASGADGVDLVRRLGAHAAVNGRAEDVAAAARVFAPRGLDAALLTAGGEAAEKALAGLRPGGRVAWPNGVEPEPAVAAGVDVVRYDGTPDRKVIEKLNRLIEAGPFEVHVARRFRLEEAVEAQKALEGHYLGKLALRMN